MTPWLIGAAIAVAVGLFGRLSGFDRDRAFYPLVLVVTASYYLLFAAMGGTASVLWIEGAILAAFAAMAVAGFRLTLWLVAAGLLAHALLDSVHPLVVANDGVPGWWPAFCLAFDVAFAAWLAGRLAIDGASPGAKLVEPVMPE